MHRWTFSPSSRTTRAWQTGQCDGKTNSRSWPVRRSGIDFTTSGMTSPARRMRTMSPIAHVLPAQLVLVVERGPRDGGAAQADRGHLGDGRQHAGAPHRGPDPLDPGGLLLRRVLEGHGPARELARRAQALLRVQVVHLHHESVGVVGEREAALGHLVLPPLHLGDAPAEPVLRVHGEAQAGQRSRASPSGSSRPGRPGRAPRRPRRRAAGWR